MKTLSRVVWSEGMYIGPHHFQTQNRYFEDSTRFAIESAFFEPWGLVSFRLDDAAIRNGEVALISAHGIFEDGLVFDMSDDRASDPLPVPRKILDVFPPLGEGMLMFLAVPCRRPGKGNCDLDGEHRDVRYRAVSANVVDMNDGGDERSVPVAHKNIRLVTEAELNDGLSNIPLARVLRDASGQLVYDSDFIPPCTKLTASERLMSVLGRLVEILEAKQNFLERPKGRAGMFQASNRQQDVANLWFLHTIQSSLGVLRHLYRTKRGHPEELFMEMSRLAGALSTFDLEFHADDLPLYNHRELQRCFTDLAARINRHLETKLPTNSVFVPIHSDGRNFYWGEVRDPRCFSRSRWILGVRSTGSEARLITRVPTVVKVCSRQWVSKLVERARPGLALAHLPMLPAAISPKVEFQYFSLDRNDQMGNPSPCWSNIVDTREVGIYVPDELTGVELELQIALDT